MQNNHKDLLALFVQIILVLFKSKFCFLMHETNINKKKIVKRVLNYIFLRWLFITYLS